MRIKAPSNEIFSSKEISERRMAIQKRWSRSERVERHRAALDAQIRLDLLISAGQMKLMHYQEMLQSTGSL